MRSDTELNEESFSQGTNDPSDPVSIPFADPLSPDTRRIHEGNEEEEGTSLDRWLDSSLGFSVVLALRWKVEGDMTAKESCREGWMGVRSRTNRSRRLSPAH
jgi:hypothetical protein